MLEKVISGSRIYWGWILFLLVVIAIGSAAYAYQFINGLTVTNMGRDVSWGLYIGQFTFFVGVAASAVMLVIPYYLHNAKVFGRLVIFGEFLAIPAVIMCLLFVIADMGKPMRMLNVVIYMRTNSILFWDFLALNGYLLLNIIIGWFALGAERKGISYPKFVRPLIYLSVPVAFSIHTVTAFIYAGLPVRHLWLTAIMAARFLASAFAAGPALLVLLLFITQKLSKCDLKLEPIKAMGKIVTYAMIANVFFLGLELFTAFYSGIESHQHPFEYLYVHASLISPLMWVSAVLGLGSLVLLITPSFNSNFNLVRIACLMVFISLWIDKGFGLVIGGFNPSPAGKFVDYWPTLVEVLVSLGIWGIGALVLTILYKVILSVRKEIRGF